MTPQTPKIPNTPNPNIPQPTPDPNTFGYGPRNVRIPFFYYKPVPGFALKSSVKLPSDCKIRVITGPVVEGEGGGWVAEVGSWGREGEGRIEVEGYWKWLEEFVENV